MYKFSFADVLGYYYRGISTTGKCPRLSGDVIGDDVVRWYINKTKADRLWFDNKYKNYEGEDYTLVAFEDWYHTMSEAVRLGTLTQEQMDSLLANALVIETSPD